MGTPSIGEQPYRRSPGRTPSNIADFIIKMPAELERWAIGGRIPSTVAWCNTFSNLRNCIEEYDSSESAHEKCE